MSKNLINLDKVRWEINEEIRTNRENSAKYKGNNDYLHQLYEGIAIGLERALYYTQADNLSHIEEQVQLFGTQETKE